MVSSIHNNASALQAFTQQMNTSANNLANVETDGFKSSRTYNVEGCPQGVDTVTIQSRQPGPKVEDTTKNDGSVKELSNTDIAEEMVQQIQAQNGFEANIAPIRTMDQMKGTLLDIIA